MLEPRQLGSRSALGRVSYHRWKVTTSVPAGPGQAADYIKHLELKLEMLDGFSRLLRFQRCRAVKEQFGDVLLTVADSPVAPTDLDIFPRTWYPSLDVFPAAFISFSATSWQSMLSLTPVEETKMWSFGKKSRKKIEI